MLYSANQPVDIAQRPNLLDLLWLQEVHLDSDGSCYTSILVVFVHTIPVHSETYIADLAEADRLPRLGLQFLVQSNGVFVHLTNRIAHIEQGQQARGVPCRARG